MFLQSNVFTRYQYFLSIDLMNFMMEYMWNQFLFKFELEIVLGTLERKESGVYILIELKVQDLLSE